MNSTRNSTKRILAMPAAVPAMPAKPSTPAMMAMIRNVSAQLSMGFLLFRVQFADMAHADVATQNTQRCSRW
ncbi:hypothetical protein D3C80_1514540 [compost metagenome]